MEIEVVKQITNEFFKKLLVNIDDIEILQEQEDIFYIKIKTPDSSLLIWYSGKNLEDIRKILRDILSKINGKNIILHIEINDYLSKKEDKLFNFILKKIEIAKSWKEVILPFFSAYDRKKIHSYVSKLKDETIFTKSVWEWSERRLHICKKSENITIDMDWIDI